MHIDRSSYIYPVVSGTQIWVASLEYICYCEECLLARGYMNSNQSTLYLVWELFDHIFSSDNVEMGFDILKTNNDIWGKLFYDHKYNICVHTM